MLGGIVISLEILVIGMGNRGSKSVANCYCKRATSRRFFNMTHIVRCTLVTEETRFLTNNFIKRISNIRQWKIKYQIGFTVAAINSPALATFFSFTTPNCTVRWGERKKEVCVAGWQVFFSRVRGNFFFSYFIGTVSRLQPKTTYRQLATDGNRRISMES